MIDNDDGTCHLTNDEWRAYQFVLDLQQEGRTPRQAVAEMLRLDSFMGMRANYRFLAWLES